jgi:hypothetical protein
MSSLRRPAVDLGKILYENLYAFATRYIKHPHPMKQYNSNQKSQLFEDTFMNLETFQERFAPGYAEAQIKIFNDENSPDHWPFGGQHSESHRAGKAPTLSEQICEYIINLISPRRWTLKSSAHNVSSTWYDHFKAEFTSFSFVYNQQILPERVLVQNLVQFLSELPPPTERKKSSYSILNFYDRKNWRQEQGKPYQLKY